MKEEAIICPNCKKSDTVIKSGKRSSMKGDKQRYRCKQCNRRFILKGKYDSYYKDEIVELALRLHNSGMSAYEISKYLRTAQNIKVSNVTIGIWIKNFK